MSMRTAIPSQAHPANQARLPRYSCMSPDFFIHPSHPIRTGPAQRAHPSHPSHPIDGISFPIMKFQSNCIPTQQLWLSNPESPVLSILYLSAKTQTIEPHSYLLPQYASLCPNCIRDYYTITSVPPCRASSAQTPPRPMSTPASIAHRSPLSGLRSERPILFRLIFYTFQQQKIHTSIR